jgi:UMF1 family MFS transporter
MTTSTALMEGWPRKGAHVANSGPDRRARAKQSFRSCCVCVCTPPIWSMETGPSDRAAVRASAAPDGPPPAASSAEVCASAAPDSPPTRPDAAPHSPHTTPREVRAFYCIDWANSVFSTVGISGFLPLLIQSAGLSAAGFPSACPNVLANATAVAATWPFLPPPPSVYLLEGASPRPCDPPPPTAPSCYRGACSGLPPTPQECRYPGGGGAVFPLRTPSGADPTAFAALCVSLSVAAQAVALVGVAAVADHGGARKPLLVRASLAGALGCALCALIGPRTWWAGLPLAAWTNVCFGITTVIYNSYLPLLVEASEGVRSLPSASAARAAAAGARSAQLSGTGFAWGYAAGVVGILLCVPLAASLPEIAAYQGAMLLCAAWWACFTLPVHSWLLPRPGPPLPPGSGGGYVRASLDSLRATARRLRALPVTWRYLALWMLFSDGVFSIGFVGGLYANGRVDWGCTPKAAGVLAVFLLVPVAAMVGNMIYLRVAETWGLSHKACVAASLVAIGVVVPLWGWGGLTRGSEVVALAGWYGLHMAPMQSFSRSLFGRLIPPGEEAAFFSVYELTNRGSSWLGPLVLSAVQQQTGSLALGFLYIAVMTLGGCVGLLCLDVEGGARAAAAGATGSAPQRGGGGGVHDGSTLRDAGEGSAVNVEALR